MSNMDVPFFTDGLTLCQKERQISLGWTGIAAPGQFVPKCKPNGDYEPVQCHGSTNFCWCVNKQGQEFPGTRARGRPECDLYGEARFYLIKVFV